MIGAVNGHMTIDTGAIKYAVVQYPVNRLIGIRTAAGRQYAGMSRIGVTALAQERGLGFQQAVVG